MQKVRLWIKIAFFAITPVLIAASILYSTHRKTLQQEVFQAVTPLPHIAYAALPDAQTNFNQEIDKDDARTEIVRQFLSRYDSPLEPYAHDIVFLADFYGIDFRLIPAIAMQESNLCKRVPKDSNNCWGWGIYGDKVIRFEDYREGIETVTKSLAKNYKKQGLAHPQDIMKKYTPSSNGSWAKGVNYFMTALE